MARKPVSPMDINEYYKAMGARPESDIWEMPRYNTVSGKPVTGQGRTASRHSGSFAAPEYNHQGKPVLSSKDVSNKRNGGAYRVEVFRPGTLPGHQFKASKYNDASGKPITSDGHQNTVGQNVFRPFQLLKSGVENSMARKESVFAFGENRKVLLNNSFSADALGAPVPIGSFTKISGLETEWELESYVEGGENGGEHLFPKQIKNSRVVFEYGMGFMDPLWRWFSMTKTGMMLKLPMMIYLTDEKGIPIKFWMLLNAMPVKYTIPNFDALASEVAITRMEFIHSGLVNIL